MNKLTAILLLLSITGIYSTFKLDVSALAGITVYAAASDKPTQTDTVTVMQTAIKAGADCATAFAPDNDIVSDFLYNNCLDQNCVTADADWTGVAKALDFDPVPLTIQACYRTCSPLATAGNALKHATCLKTGLTAAGVIATKLMMDFVVLGPVSLYYADSLVTTETTPLKFNTYGRYMRDVAKSCNEHGHNTLGLWELSVPVANSGRIFHLVHAAKVKKMGDASICSTVINTSAKQTDTLDLKKASDCLLAAAKIAFPADDTWLSCAADAALPVTAGRLNLAKVYAPDGEQTFDQKDKGGKLDAIYTSFASCIGALAGTAFNYAEVYQGYLNTNTNYFGLNAPTGKNQQVNVDLLGINVLHDKGYQVKHCYVHDAQCMNFSNGFHTTSRLVKNYNRLVIQALNACYETCLGAFTMATATADNVLAHSDAYNLITANAGVMTLQSHYKAEAAKYEKCHTDFKDSWYKTQRMIREE